ncbi:MULTISPECIES: ABC transporter ATP-binding protein [unclassified Beijerinckia]|uniref:ABC transporter ATP-binding protein n=1 Tax=unclassified Beijerinckia TaxID=2638183 RepID=UPI00089B1578|nr:MULTISPECIES: ABC transporter ATP-binding protein [unclassified Beijerinckia]MDH7795471.1 ABC-type nitrate/sulfonate/bicarbonate transport system ATPase subunit [Beijerinckia sp. GAS462]SEC02941.1 sulfonate transport system ATP-binding protein [Beijerinckia sp. 28-YEA-48]
MSLASPLASPDAIVFQPMALPPTLSLRGVGKQYQVDGRDLPVLRQIDIDLRRGEFLSIVGASGCGKSTLLRLIVGLDDQFDGDILIDGQAIQGPGGERSIVFQDHRLFPWLTIADNVALGLDSFDIAAKERDQRVAELLELVGLSNFAGAYPHQLSGGMAQRAAIARALVSDPEILLMDEPFGALDSLTRSYLQEELLRIWAARKVTAIVVTHDVEEALFLSDTVIVMEPRPGRIQNLIHVDLPRPRDRASPAFSALKTKILSTLRR